MREGGAIALVSVLGPDRPADGGEQGIATARDRHQGEENDVRAFLPRLCRNNLMEPSARLAATRIRARREGALILLQNGWVAQPHELAHPHQSPQPLAL